MYIQDKKGLKVRGFIGPAASYRLAPGFGYDVREDLAGFQVSAALAGCGSCMGAALAAPASPQGIPFTESLGDATMGSLEWMIPALLAGGVLLIFAGTLKQKGH